MFLTANPLLRFAITNSDAHARVKSNEGRSKVEI